MLIKKEANKDVRRNLVLRVSSVFTLNSEQFTEFIKSQHLTSVVKMSPGYQLYHLFMGIDCVISAVISSSYTMNLQVCSLLITYILEYLYINMHIQLCFFL